MVEPLYRVIKALSTKQLHPTLKSKGEFTPSIDEWMIDFSSVLFLALLPQKAPTHLT